jgi:hypothetical protein
MKLSPLHTALTLVAATWVGSAEALTIYVTPQVVEHGKGTRSSPLGSIQAALEAAQPGDTIQLAPGRYLQDIKTVRSGTPAKPITVKGARGRSAPVISGAGAPRVVEVSHDYITLQDFVVDGRHGTDERKESYRDVLLYVVGETPADGVIGLTITGLTFRNARSECLHLRYDSASHEITDVSFDDC